MSDKELIEWCKSLEKNINILKIPEDIFLSLDRSQAELIIKELGSSLLMQLPERETDFFEWLKEIEPSVWEDLWEGTENREYYVGISFLPLLTDKVRGFPICDLVYNDNYYFTSAHIIDHESKIVLDSAKERLLNRDNLTIAQLLMLQISIAPIDIWHFSYNFNLTPENAKKAVEELVEDNALIHLRDANHLAQFVEF